MKAIVVEQTADGPLLRWETVPDPVPGPAEVLVAVGATAVNRADLSQARGAYPPPPGASDILGLEMAGVIVARGDEVTGWAVGDRVCALLAGGGYAEMVTVPYEMLMPVPPGWTFDEATAVPEVWFTAYVNLFGEGQLRAGEWALIHAGASGVGTAAIQLAVGHGAPALATAGTDEKVARCEALGATRAFNYKTMAFVDGVREVTEGAGVDVILDPVGAAYLADNLALLRDNGRLVHIGLLSGREATLNLGLLMGKSLRLIGSRLRPRPLAEKIAITRRFQKEVWPGLIAGRYRTVIDRHFPIAAAQEAHAYVRDNRNIGKVILQVTENAN